MSKTVDPYVVKYFKFLYTGMTTLGMAGRSHGLLVAGTPSMWTCRSTTGNSQCKGYIGSVLHQQLCKKRIKSAWGDICVGHLTLCGGVSVSGTTRAESLSTQQDDPSTSERSAQEATMDVIEWPILCQYVAGFAQTAMGQRACAQHVVPPSTEAGALRMIRETMAVQLMQEQFVAEIDFGGIQTFEAEESLKRVNRGGMLSGSELLALASLIRGGIKIQSKIMDCASQAEDIGELESIKPVSDMFTEHLGDLPGHLATQIIGKIEESGKVKESASDDVRKASGRVRTLESRVRGILKNSGEQIEEHGGRLCVVVSAQGRAPPKGSVTVGGKLGGSAWVIEPPAAVSINNELVSAKQDLRVAEEAVLWDLTRMISKHHQELAQCLSAIIWLDGINAKYRFGNWISGTLVTEFQQFRKTGKARGKKAVPQECSDEDSQYIVMIRQLRHPLLMAAHLRHASRRSKVLKNVPLSSSATATSQKRLPGWRKQASHESGSDDDADESYTGPVPIDIFVEQGTRGIIITGPNTGGKTASLKALGLVCNMVKCGIPIPAEAPARIPCFDKVLADIGDEQSLSSSLSTFSGHLKRIESLRKESTGKSLVLLDELGTGTDAIDGAALGIALMNAFAQNGPGGSALTLASTHHNALTTLKYDHPGLFDNASVEFDEVNLQPTYKVIWGVPGRSCALNIAERLNLDEDIVQRARNLLGRDANNVDEQLITLESLRKQEDDIALEIRRIEAAKKKVEASIKQTRYVFLYMYIYVCVDCVSSKHVPPEHHHHQQSQERKKGADVWFFSCNNQSKKSHLQHPRFVIKNSFQQILFWIKR